MGSTRSFPALGFDPAPGDVGSVTALGEMLTSHAGKIGEAPGSLGTAGAGPWEGVAAEGFRGQAGQLAGRVGDTAGIMVAAGGLIGRWAGELSAMQSAANQLEAQAAQRLQSAQSNPALSLAGQRFPDQAAAQQAQQQYQSANAEVSASEGALEAIRQQARQLLQRHEQLATEMAGGLTRALGGDVSISGSATGSGPTLSGSATGPGIRDGKLSLGSAEGSALLASGSAEGTLGVGGLELAGKASGGIGAEGSAGAHLGLDGLVAEAQGRASATLDHTGLNAQAGGFVGVRAEAGGEARYGNVALGGSGYVSAGAEGEAHLNVGTSGIDAGVTGFVGTKAGGEVHADLGGVTIGLQGEALSGYGADAGVVAARGEDGRYHFGVHGGGAFEGGTKGGVYVTVDPQGVADTASAGADAIADAVGGKPAHDITEGFSKAVHTVADAL